MIDLAGQTPAAVREQVEKIVASSGFKRSPQIARFLRFCVEQRLGGQEHRLKEGVLAIEVLQRREAFDPRLDCIVRVEARRLRAKLAHYYLTDGRYDEIRILFSPGSYVPRIMARGGQSILIVEDERLVARDVQHRLTALGYTVCGSTGSGAAAIEMAESNSPDLVLMDIRLPGAVSGTEAARSIRSRFGIPIVYLTAHSDAPTLESAKAADPFGYVLKPFDGRQLHAALQMAFARRQQELSGAAPRLAPEPGFHLAHEPVN